MVLLHQSINFQYELGSDISIYLNCAIFVDLYLNIKNPFSPKEKRMKWYYLGSILIVLEMIILYAAFEPSPQTKDPYHYQNQDKLAIQAWTNFLFTLITIVAATILVFRLKQQGTSQELRTVVLKRHILYFCFFFIFMVHTNMHVLDKIGIIRNVSKDGFWVIAQITNLSGLSFAIIRFIEPFVYQNFLYSIKNLCCLKKIFR